MITSKCVPRMYCTPKIHKPGTLLRPIVDYTGSIKYATSRSVADILASLTGKTEHHVSNSQQLLVTSLRYLWRKVKSSIPRCGFTFHQSDRDIDETLNIIRERLESDRDLKKRTLLTVNMLMISWNSSNFSASPSTLFSVVKYIANVSAQQSWVLGLLC